MYIFLLVLCGGQDKPAWTACPQGVKITRVGARYPGTACPMGGASCPGGKIKWDTVYPGGKINCYTGAVGISA